MGAENGYERVDEDGFTVLQRKADEEKRIRHLLPGNFDGKVVTIEYVLEG